MDILVTGGAGYIGTSLIERLHGMGCVNRIHILDNLSQSQTSFFWGAGKLNKVNFIKGDILDGNTLDNIVTKVDTVYHLAGYVNSPYNYAQSVQYEQVNQWGTLNLVRSIQNCSNRIKRFVYLSSAAVYGMRENINVNDGPLPTNAYGASKLNAEKFVKLLNSDITVNIIRAGNAFGY